MAKQRRKEYSFDERLTCFTWFVHGHTLEEIAKHREPSVETLKRWSREEMWEARRAKINEDALRQIHVELTQQKARFVVDAWQTIHSLLQAVADPERVAKASVHHLTTAIGTLIDKAALVQQGGVPGGWTDEDFGDDAIDEAEKTAASWKSED